MFRVSERKENLHYMEQFLLAHSVHFSIVVGRLRLVQCTTAYTRVILKHTLHAMCLQTNSINRTEPAAALCDCEPII